MAPQKATQPAGFRYGTQPENPAAFFYILIANDSLRSLLNTSRFDKRWKLIAPQKTTQPAGFRLSTPFGKPGSVYPSLNSKYFYYSPVVFITQVAHSKEEAIALLHLKH